MRGFLSLVPLALVCLIASCQASDVEHLKNIFHNSNGAEWRHTKGWKSGSNPCDEKWEMVTCNNEGRVTGLDMFYNNLGPEIVEDFAKLDELKFLSLGSNNFQGPLPEHLCQLKNLEFLDLSGNTLSGVLPECLGHLEKLTDLYLYQNEFTGAVPESYTNLSNLEYIDLSSNRLESVPDNLRNISSLRSGYFFDNEFEDPLDPHFLEEEEEEGAQEAYEEAEPEAQEVPTSRLHARRLPTDPEEKDDPSHNPEFPDYVDHDEL